MTKILVTGSTGHLGRGTLEALLRRRPADQLVGLARDPDKALELTQLGIEIRKGDYFDSDSLVSAFDGVDKLLLVSAVAFTDRLAQHLNVIEAAKLAGVKHVVYTSVQRREGSNVSISMVTDSDRATEDALMRSSLEFTILRNNLYLEALPLIIGMDPVSNGVRVCGGAGKVAIVSRGDLAEATANVMTEEGHEGKTYSLGGDEAPSFSDIAVTLGGVANKQVEYVETPVDTFVAERIAAGFPEPVARFLAEWVQAIAVDELSEVTGDLSRLLGREPTNYRAYLKSVYGTPSAAQS